MDGNLGPASGTSSRTEGGPRGAGSTLPDDDQRARAATRREGRLAGALFIASPLLSVPASLVMEPLPSVSVYLLTVAAIAAGVLCLLAPWERISRLWLHLAGAFATVEITIAIALAQTSYAFFYIFVAVFAAYVARSRVELAIQVGLIALGLLAPVAYDPDAAQEAIQLALLAIPALAISAALVFQLREQLEAERVAYRRFAEEALSLAARIRGKEAALPEPPRQTTPDVAAPQVPRTWRGPALAALAVLLGVPLASAGLATAGIRLPEAVSDRFEAIGIALPNQDGDAGPLGSHDGRVPVRASETDEGAEPSAAVAAGARGGRNRGSDERPAAAEKAPNAPGGANRDVVATGADGVATTIEADHAAGGESKSDPGPSQPATGESLDERVRETLDQVGGLLDGLNLNGQQ